MNILNAYDEFDSQHFDLNVDHYGAEVCARNYSFGPTIRDNYVLHFILNGKGTFMIDGQTTLLQEGDIFVLPKDKLTFYQADAKEPWAYIWVGFSGSRVESFLRQSTLLDHYYLHSSQESQILEDMMAIARQARHGHGVIRELFLIGELHKLLGHLIEEFPQKELSESKHIAHSYVQQAMKMIHAQYGSPLKVADIAENLSLSRSYLYKIFKEETGYSIKDYILHVKMNRSTQLLQNLSLSIAEVAYSVGYKDPLNFSSTFKHYYHISPSDYRKQQSQPLL
ncbi:AraC family transcriptional regulator [Streptococcus sp. DD13]|uniref:AraC family transcriptional regulator n=1 Tax=Streptococcus sp. DD13 TaxID=1777881 RepID=UPI00079C3EE1|nr:AraC family transcriptional regulator [Streptococcus sp. DD13]KXT77679.1 MSM (multiple sugar metabolism) operon regulatory protein [Streptococcus sp. DD13]